MDNTARKNIAKAFRIAKSYLSDTCDDTYGGDDGHTYRHEYICHCLDRAHTLCKISMKTRRLTDSIIYERLRVDGCGNAYYGSLGGWLRFNHPELIGQFHADPKGIKMQVTRRAWLDSLIKEFGSKK